MANKNETRATSQKEKYGRLIMGSIILKRGMKPTEEVLKRVRENAPKSDDEIDFSDIPEITEEEWKRFKPARLRKKKNIAD